MKKITKSEQKLSFCREFRALFSEDELIFFASEASLLFENDDGEIDYMLWLRDDDNDAEIRTDYGLVEIRNLCYFTEEEVYEKYEYIEILKRTKIKKFIEIRVD